MSLNIYDTAVLNRVVPSLDEPANFLLDMGFPEVQFSETERIYFDVENFRPRIAPFVAAHMPGKVVDEVGFTTKDFAPAYVKDKRRFTPKGALKRRIGEAIGGSMSPQQREAARLNDALVDQMTMLTRREEVMASEVLRTGKVTVSGEGYATQVVDFGRDVTLTVSALSSNDRWTVNHTDSNPLADLETWAALPQSKGGGAITEFILDPYAWRAMRTRLVERGEGQVLLDFARSGGATLEMGPLAAGPKVKARRIGVFGSFNLWTYDDLYLDDAGVSQHMMPNYTVIGLSGDLLGTRCYGVIEDAESGFASTRFFSKSWAEHDPSVRWLLMQSAPLVVPYRPNASFCATVHQ